MKQKSPVILILALLPAFACAEDNLQTVLKRMKTDTATSLAYTEKRAMKVLTTDWHGAGVLYAAPPHTMLKEQQTPDIEIMAIEGQQAYYFQANNNQRYQAELDENQPHTVAFNELLHDDVVTLEKLYEVSFAKQAGKNWTVTLVSKNKAATSKQPAKIIVTGLAEKPAHVVTVIQTDGDRSEFTLTPLAKGATVQANIDRLLKHIKGQP
jgi:outer membrane lipoprotein-sorting protein